MDNTLDNTLNKIKELREQCLEAKNCQDWRKLLSLAQVGAELENKHPRWQEWWGEALKQLGQTEESERHLAEAKELKRVLWQRQVEADIRGQHNLTIAANKPSLPNEE